MVVFQKDKQKFSFELVLNLSTCRRQETRKWNMVGQGSEDEGTVQTPYSGEWEHGG